MDGINTLPKKMLIKHFIGLCCSISTPINWKLINGEAPPILAKIDEEGNAASKLLLTHGEGSSCYSRIQFQVIGLRLESPI